MAETYRADWLSAARAAASLFGGRTTCEACKSIDVRLWHRQGRLRVGACFSWSWRAGGEPYGNMDVRVEGDAVVLSYRIGSAICFDRGKIGSSARKLWH